MAKRILIVEADGIVALDLKLMLVDMGFETPTIVATSMEALEAVKKNAPLLIITEIRLQGDSDGIETVMRINHKVGAPVIYLTTQSDREALDRAKKTNPFGYIQAIFRHPSANVGGTGSSWARKRLRGKECLRRTNFV